MLAAEVLPQLSPATQQGFVPSTLSPLQHRTLVLNADFRPLGFPLLTLSAQDVVSAVILERVHIVKQSNSYMHSPSLEFRLPSIVALKEYLHVPGMHAAAPFNRHNLFVRDCGRCMYTGKKLKLKGQDKQNVATIDHVIPVCRGGATSWQNCVLSSFSANVQKGHAPLATCGFSLIHQPWVPTAADLLHLWLTEERLADMNGDWLEFIAPQPSPRVAAVLAKLKEAA